jgi:hypothetical protein
MRLWRRWWLHRCVCGLVYGAWRRAQLRRKMHPHAILASSMSINVDKDTRNRPSCASLQLFRWWRMLQCVLKTDTQPESHESITDAIQLCVAKIVMKKIWDSTTTQISATIMAIDRNWRRLQADSERSWQKWKSGLNHTLLLLRCIAKCLHYDYARNDGIISRSLIALSVW